MIFRRKTRPTVTNESYSRWLRAGRPPMEWFLPLSELEQEQLALLGDAYQQDVAIAIGYAVADPELADAGLSAAEGDSGAEETLARRRAAEIAERLLQRGQHEPSASAAAGDSYSVPGSMAGLGARRQAAQEVRQKWQDGRRSFFGRAPDSLRAKGDE